MMSVRRIGWVLSVLVLFPLAAHAVKLPRRINYPRYNPGKNAKVGRHADVAFQTDDAVLVRVTDPPVEYDEKGNIKTPSKEELQTLKGPDKTLPGYPGEYDNLANGQTVVVYLSRKLPPKTDTSKDKAAGKASDAKAADDKAQDATTTDKPRWKFLVKVAGQVKGMRGSNKGGSNKGGSKNKASSDKSLTLQLDAVTLAALQPYTSTASGQDADPNSKKNKLTVGDDVYVTMIVVTSSPDKTQK